MATTLRSPTPTTAVLRRLPVLAVLQLLQLCILLLPSTNAITLTCPGGEAAVSDLIVTNNNSTTTTLAQGGFKVTINAVPLTPERDDPDDSEMSFIRHKGAYLFAVESLSDATPFQGALLRLNQANESDFVFVPPSSDGLEQRSPTCVAPTIGITLPASSGGEAGDWTNYTKAAGFFETQRLENITLDVTVVTATASSVTYAYDQFVVGVQGEATLAPTMAPTMMGMMEGSDNNATVTTVTVAPAGPEDNSTTAMTPTTAPASNGDDTGNNSTDTTDTDANNNTTDTTNTTTTTATNDTDTNLTMVPSTAPVSVAPVTAFPTFPPVPPSTFAPIPQGPTRAPVAAPPTSNAGTKVPLSNRWFGVVAMTTTTTTMLVVVTMAMVWG